LGEQIRFGVKHSLTTHVKQYVRDVVIHCFGRQGTTNLSLQKKQLFVVASFTYAVCNHHLPARRNDSYRQPENMCC